MNPEKSKLKTFVALDIARGIGDPVLLEKVYALSNQFAPDQINFEVGELWLKKGEPELAIKCLENVKMDTFRSEELLREAYRQTGNKEKEKRLLWKIFKSEQTKESFDSLITAEGEEKYQSILEAEVQKIKESLKLHERHVTFFLGMGLYNEAENYIWERISQLDGDRYYDLPRWAEHFEENKHYVMASAIYRELINSILKRANSKAYHYGVDYLKKLDEFECFIHNWHPLDSHRCYFDRIKKEHSRKSSFWCQYKEGAGL